MAKRSKQKSKRYKLSKEQKYLFRCFMDLLQGSDMSYSEINDVYGLALYTMGVEDATASFQENN